MADFDCDDLAGIADELALGAVTGRERAQALEHLGACRRCRETVRRRLPAAAALPGLLPARDPPPGFDAAVLARLGLAIPRPRNGEDT